ncbi:MAG: nitrate reductase subunit beta, partial [Acidimicrobiia bacterium]|nr:nitrate reductase subunit beta [Acidimicrobiia bacterium]
LKKMLAVRTYKRRQSVDGEINESTLALLEAAGTTPEEVEAIYKLTTIPTIEERFVLPPYHREMSIETLNDPLAYKGATGFGPIESPRRGA